MALEYTVGYFLAVLLHPETGMLYPYNHHDIDRRRIAVIEQ